MSEKFGGRRGRRDRFEHLTSEQGDPVIPVAPNAERPVPVVDTAEAEGTPEAERPATELTDEQWELKHIRDFPASGELHGKKLWQGENGSLYIEDENAGVLRMAHGGKHVFQDLDGKPDVRYWNAETGQLSDVDPAPEIRAAAALAKETYKARKEVSAAETAQEEDRLDEARKNLSIRINDFDISDEDRAKLAADVAAMKTHTERRALMDRMKTMPVKQVVEVAPTSAAPEAAPASAPTVVPAVDPTPSTIDQQRDPKLSEESLKRRINRLRGGDGKKLDNQQREFLGQMLSKAKSPEDLRAFSEYLSEREQKKAAHADAIPPLGSLNRGQSFEMHGGKLYVRNGKQVRFATSEEMTKFLSLGEPDKEEKPTGKLDVAPVDLKRDSVKEDHYEMNNGFIKSEEQIMNLLAKLASRERNKAAGNGSPPPEPPASPSTIDDNRNEFAQDHRGAPPTPPPGGTGGGQGGGGGGNGGPDAGGPTGAPPEAPRPTAGRVIERNVTEYIEAPDWNTRRKEFAGLKPKSVRELLASPTDEMYFGMLVESLAPENKDVLRKSITEEPLHPNERKMLDYARHEYARRMKQIESIRGLIKTSDLELVARRDPDFSAALGLNGVERTAELFKGQILHMGMKNRQLLDRLYHTYNNLSHLRETSRYKDWEFDVKVLCQRAGVEADDFDWAFNTQSPESRRESKEALAEKFHNSYGSFMRVVDKVYPFSGRKADKLMRKAVRVNDKLVRSYLSPQSAVMSKVENELKSLTAVMQVTISKNPEVMQMLEQEAFRNENLKLGTESGPHTYADAQKEKKEVPKTADELLKAHVDGFKSRAGLDWDHTSVEERQASLNPVRASIRQTENASGQGWFARALAAVFNTLFKTRAEAAINKPVLATA